MSDQLSLDEHVDNIPPTTVSRTSINRQIPQGIMEKLARAHFDKTGKNRVGGVALTTTTVEAFPTAPETTTTPPTTEVPTTTTVPTVVQSIPVPHNP